MTVKPRIFVLLLALACAAGLFSITAAAEEDDLLVKDIFAFTLSGAEATILDVDDSQEEVTVPDTLSGCTVTRIASGAVGGSTVIRRVTLLNGIRELMPMSFAYATSLETVSLPPSLRTIGDHAFYHCDSLKSVSVPGGVTGIGEMAFGRCEALTTVIIPETVTELGENLFYSVSGVTLYGKYGSAAHSYALNHQLTFQELITVALNGTRIPFDQPPVIDPSTNRTLVPMRAILEQLGAAVSWDAASSTATASKDGVALSIQIDAPSMTVNGTSRPLEAPARIVNDRTVLPVRAIAEAFGLTVGWDDAASQVELKN